jgi:hypothetical protein
MTTRTFEKVNDIFNCKLLLEDGSEFEIPLREDGYIYATGLCKVAGKKMYDWSRLKETRNLKSTLEKSETGIPAAQLIEVYRGNSSKYSQGTWIHPDLGLNLAQWCSTNFSAQVSKWLRELIYTGKVELGNEKSNEEIDVVLQEALLKLKETEKKLDQAENLVKAYDASNKELSKKYRTIKLNHQAYLKHKELYKLKTGPCVYIIDMKKTYDEEEIMRYKIGQTGDITARVSGFRTANPFCKVLAILYCDNNIDLEKSMKLRYQEQLLPNNSEFVTGVTKETLVEDLMKVANVLNIKYTVETEDELNKFNRHIILEKDVVEEEDNKTPEGSKRCGGLHHKTEESRSQPLTNYFKNQGNTDGYARLCKECFLIGVYGDKRKKRKVVVIPEHDITFQKWCNLCETIKEHKDFYSDKAKKDGLNANCKACKHEQKMRYTEKRKKPEEKAKPQTLAINTVQEIENRNPLERYSKNELRELVIKKGMKITFKKTKDEMIKMLQPKE